MDTNTIYYNQDMTMPIAIIIGSEGFGMSRLVKENCDFLVKIPMNGKITSLNASVSAGIIMYEVVKQKTDITIKAANASSESTVTEMSDYLTAVWNSYQVANDELESTVDIMAALGAKTATSMEEIASAMQKVASVGNSVGVDFD